MVPCTYLLVQLKRFNLERATVNPSSSRTVALLTKPLQLTAPQLQGSLSFPENLQSPVIIHLLFSIEMPAIQSLQSCPSCLVFIPQ